MRSVIRQACIGVQIGIKPHIKIALFCAGKSDELKNRLYNENRSTNYGAEEKNCVKARFETLEHMFYFGTWRSKKRVPLLFQKSIRRLRF